MRFIRFESVLLLVALALLAGCSFLAETPEYDLELAVDRVAFKSTDDPVVHVTYRITVSEEENLRARFSLTGADGSEIENGVLSDIVSGVQQVRTVDLEGYPINIEQGRYSFRLVGQTRKGDGTYADLAFLDKTVAFYLDDDPPGLPTFLTPEGVYVDSVEVRLSHPEWDTPTGSESPVELHYTKDGSTPTAASPRYTGAITLTATASPTAVKAIAVDQAGNDSGLSPWFPQYGFLEVSDVYPSASASKTQNSPIGSIATRIIYGWGFGPVSDVTLVDADGTDVNVSILYADDDEVDIAIGFNSYSGGTIVGPTTGVGRLSVVVDNPDPAPDAVFTLPFTILD